MALYDARLFYLSELIEQTIPRPLVRRMLPEGAESYQRALFRKSRDS
jgi:hypothetical protein